MSALTLPHSLKQAWAAHIAGDGMVPNEQAPRCGFYGCVKAVLHTDDCESDPPLKGWDAFIQQMDGRIMRYAYAELLAQVANEPPA